MSKKGDIFDGMLFYAKKAELDPYKNKILSYPPDVQDLLSEFVKIWSIAIDKIPDGNSSRWIKEARELRKIVGYGSKMKSIFQRAFDFYKNLSFYIESPISVAKICRTAAEDIEKENRDRKERLEKAMQQKKIQDDIKNEDEEKRKKAIEELNSLKKKWRNKDE